VLGGALVMCAGAALAGGSLFNLSSIRAFPARRLGRAWCGILWGTMYIPYRKAYLTGMNPLSFVTFFSFGEWE